MKFVQIETSMYAQFEQGRPLDLAINTKEAVMRHMTETKGRPRFRFPPEPNGYLHIGHAKSMFINFGSAIKANEIG